MDIKGLRFFQGVLRYKSITKASEHLYIAQPALGLQIRKLETELGVQLFQRHSRGVTPTEAGLLLAEHAEVILRQVERARQDLQDYSKSPRGRVTIGLSPTTSQLLATTLAERVREAYPEIVLSISEGLSEQLMEWVEKERVDLALTYNPNASGDVEVERLALEVLHFVRPPGAAAKGPVKLATVLAEPLVLPSRPHLLRLQVDEAARTLGMEAPVAYEVDSVPMIREFVKRGFGNTVLPLGAIRAALGKGTLRADPILAPEIERTLYLAYSHARPPSKAFLSVADLLRDITLEMIENGDAGWRSTVQELRAAG
jgi:LysR family nitrogen assimilation transcriptional regulator